MKKYLPYILIAALALGVWLYLNRGKCKLCKLFQAQREPEKTQQENTSDEPVSGYPPSGGGAGFQPGDVTSLIPVIAYDVAPRMTYQQVVVKRAPGTVVKRAKEVIKLKGGKVTTPSGNTATIAANPNKPVFT